VIVLPLLFIFGVWIPDDELPAGMRQVADVFPIKHVFAALLKAFDPATAGTARSPRDLAVVAAWGVAGLLVALRRFAWTPQSA